MVYTRTPSPAIVSASASSTLRTPISTAFPGSRRAAPGANPPTRVSASGPRPNSAAIGIPCRFPLGEVSGVFASACASTHTSPSRSTRPPFPPAGLPEGLPDPVIPDTVPSAME